MTREYRLDNGKALLIFLVVFGHLLELNNSILAGTIYKIIYLFHMPLFLFIAGYFAKWNPKRIFGKLLGSYLIFQMLYILFAMYMLPGTYDMGIQFTTPYWILWYLPVLVYCQIIVHFIETDKAWLQWMECGASLVVALAVGYFSRIGSFLALSRFFVFMPFFLLGFYCRKNEWLEGVWKRTKYEDTEKNTQKEIENQNKKAIKREKLYAEKGNLYRRVAILGSLLLVLCTTALALKKQVTPQMLYGSASYVAAGYSMGMRFLILFCGVAWGMFILSILPENRIPVFTEIGKYTFEIFLLHGFVIRLLWKYQVLHLGVYGNFCLSILFAAMIVGALAEIAYIFNKMKRVDGLGKRGDDRKE